MALKPRHKWIASRISDSFDVDFGVAERFVYAEQGVFDESLSGTVSKVFVFFYPKAQYTPDGEWKATGSSKELFISTGQGAPIQGKAVFFLYNGAGKPVDESKANDGTFLSGEVAGDPMSSLHYQLTGLFSRYLHEKSDWGKAKDDITKDILEGVDEFSGELSRTIESRAAGVDLPMLSEYLSLDDLLEFVANMPSATKKAKGKRIPYVNPRVVLDCVRIVTAWCDIVQKQLQEGSAMDQSDEVGPKDVLIWWRRRMERLSSITEQLKSKNSSCVLAVLLAAGRSGQPTCSANVLYPEQEVTTEKDAEQSAGAAKGGATAAESKSSEEEGKSPEGPPPPGGAKARKDWQLGYPSGIVDLTRQWKEINMGLTEAANEAKDNVKYLYTLEKFIEPLYTGSPVVIVDALPALLNSIKMVRTIARYFSSDERITDLLVKIANQLIASSKTWIMGAGTDGPDGHLVDAGNPSLWTRPPAALVQRLRDGLELNRAFYETYRSIRDRSLEEGAINPFQFSETALFARFDLFCRRCAKLAHLFGTIAQFEAIKGHRLEGMGLATKRFNEVVKAMKAKKHDLLAFTDGAFDRDFVEFNVQINEIEGLLQQFINASFEQVSKLGIEGSLQLLHKYQGILTRPALAADLDDKMHVIFQTFGAELDRVQQLYETHKSNPPKPRNMPPVAGNIAWARHLFYRIEAPMKAFQENPAVLATKEARQVVKTYNRVARGLVAFEHIWFMAWTESIAAAKAGLQATLLIRHPDDGRLYVNFDTEILQLTRETKCLVRLGREDIPEHARMVLMQEDKFKAYYSQLSHILKEYQRVQDNIIPVTRGLLQPAIEDLEYNLRPGMVTLTWTSMNISQFKANVLSSLRKLDELVTNVNDIIENRIELNLKIISKEKLVDLPEGTSMELHEFVDAQKQHTSQSRHLINSKNIEVERAVEDLLAMVQSHVVDPHIAPVAEEDLIRMKAHYNHYMYSALLSSAKSSLNALKKRVTARMGMGKLFTIQRPFFSVDVQLVAPDVRLSPSLDDVQASINKAAVFVLGCSKSAFDWGQMDVPLEERVTFFDRITKDIEVVRVVLLLTGSVQGVREQVAEFLATFRKYNWLWLQDADAEYAEFMAKKPGIDDYDRALNRFLDVEQEVMGIDPVFVLGALALKTGKMKDQLHHEVRRWMRQYIVNLHRLASERLTTLTDYCKITRTQLGREVDSLNSLSYIMGLLREVRKRQSGIHSEIEPIMDMFSMLKRYGAEISQTEEDERALLWVNWGKLVDKAEEAASSIAVLQADFRRELFRNVRGFRQDAAAFRKDFEENGPMREGIAPEEAMECLRRFEDEFQMRERKRELYQGGEKLFAVPVTEYPLLDKTRKELGLLHKLYGLFKDVMDKKNEWDTIMWVDASQNIETMTTEMEGFEARQKKMPSKLRQWQAFQALQKEIEDAMTVIPILQELSKDTVLPRHWDQLNELLGTGDSPIDPSDPEFALSQLMSLPLVENSDELLEITDGADKEAVLRGKLDELVARWAEREYVFEEMRTRPQVKVLKGEKGIMEELDEDQMNLTQMLTSRNIKPMKEEAQEKLQLLSDCSETLAMWSKVQQTWSSLESVFLAGDIMKAMPMVAKRFQKVDKDFVHCMARANDEAIVTKATMNEVLRSYLPLMNGELQFCYNKLDQYLETKRSIFPRFYFVSDDKLLKILSKGSDLEAVQEFFDAVFARIARVVYDPTDPVVIRTIRSKFKGAWEDVDMVEGVRAEGNIEDWFNRLLQGQCLSLKALCEECAAQIATMTGFDQLRAFVDSQIGQYALLGIQLMWTTDLEGALSNLKKDPKAMDKARNKHTELTKLLSSWCLEDLGTKANRVKMEVMITIQVHQQDVAAELATLVRQRRIKSANSFDWLKQGRFYWEADAEDFINDEGRLRINFVDVNFDYQYEYLGIKDRLVITPLTDRCYITLTQALGMYMGGAPAGPAGTGKTESVKELGATLGINVVVTNCSDQMHYQDCAKIFKGLSQSGLWGCFDEFNRITLPVLSVVAQQVQSINDAKRNNLASFEFLGEPGVKLNPVCGYFITMNPGYAGRQELPENLKALFRGVAMMVPDREIIMKVKLCSVGYQDFEYLAKKFFICYDLCEQQLSKQKHYDFGLRNILSVLRTAGQTKRDNVEKQEEELLYQTLRDMNLSKMVAQDVPLFESMLKDLFPKIKNPAKQSFPDVEEALYWVIDNGVKEGLLDKRIVAHPSWVNNVLQLYATCLVRHGIMLTGPTGGGKTMIFNMLQRCLERVGDKTPHKLIRLNPKAIAATELYGHTDPRSGEWVRGVFAAIWERYNSADLEYYTWIVEDGPVDAIWIEDLNTVLDDNRILTLSNGDRFPMTDNTKIMFENETLKNASPATVSRAGIIYVSDTDLDWLPIIQAWLLDRPESQRAAFQGIFDRTLGTCTPEDPGPNFSFLIRETAEVMPSSRVGKTSAMLRLIESLVAMHKDKLSGMYAPAAGAEPEAATETPLGRALEKITMYAMCWSLGGLLEDEDRIKYDSYLRTLSQQMPPEQEGVTIYEQVLSDAALEWTTWAPPIWEYPSHQDPLDFSNLLVPTMDSTRSLYLLERLHGTEVPVLMVGGPGTAKTSTALMFFATFGDERVVKRINFSSATEPRMLQDSVESSLDKRGRNYAPPAGKKMTVFIDDVSMPEINTWGDQPTNELTRQLVEYSGLYFLEKDKRGDFKRMESLTWVAAMKHPGGGRNDIPERLKRHFFMFNLVLPSIKSIDDLYGYMLQGRFPDGELSADAGKVVDLLTKATIELWDWAKRKLLPTPAKFHYVFNMRELSRVFQGVLLCPKETIKTGGQQTPSDDQHLTLLRLWKHECSRVFEDKLTNNPDKESFRSALARVTIEVFGDDLAGKVNEEAFFVDFFRDDVFDEDEVLIEEAPKVYEPGGDLDSVRSKVLEYMAKHNTDNPARRLDLVLFEDALRHLIRISRIIQMPRGSALLVGVGGSGKQSLTRLAAYIARSTLFQITLTKMYNVGSFMEDLKKVFDIAGHQRKSVTFLFTDAEIKDEAFLEYINNVLMVGEVAGLFAKDEMMAMTADLVKDFLKERPGMEETQENLNQFFLENARDNLHLVLCMSPVNAKFPERARKFPGLVSATSIDWFLPWPQEALVSVSRGFLGSFEVEAKPEEKDQLIYHIGSVHSTVVGVCDEYYTAMRRRVYQTPKSFLAFIKNYTGKYKEKLAEVEAKEQSVNLGLEKLIKGAEDVEVLKGKIAEENRQVQAATIEVNKLLAVLKVDQADAEEKAKRVNEIKETCEAEKNRIAGEKEACEADLAKAQPIVDAANSAIASIKPTDIQEIKGMKKPSPLIKLVCDGVLVLMMKPMVKVAPDTHTIKGSDYAHLVPSWDIAIKTLTSATFLADLQNFKKDNVNEETCELVAAYTQQSFYSPENAGNAAKAAKGLATWVWAMREYFYAARIVRPKLEALAIAEGQLAEAMAKLASAEAEMRAVENKLAELKAGFDKAMADKQEKEDSAAALQAKMEMAEALINGLSGERVRWTNDSKSFADMKRRLIGDVAVACAFMSYCGPFNSTFREMLVNKKFIGDLRSRNVPVTTGLDVIKFSVTDGIIGDWNIDGLPTDPLSIQNGILVTSASRYPLLVDPQGQAFSWITQMERRAESLPDFEVTQLTNPKLKDQLEFCMGEGKSLVVVNVEEELDPLLDPVLEKQIIQKTKTRKIIRVADQEMDLSDDFKLFFITRLPNPHFSPELQAKTTVVDFTVTMQGLEDQLLGIVIQREQKALEEQLAQVLQDVNENRKMLASLDAQLLAKLSGGKGNLLEEEGLVEMLSETKAAAAEVAEKLNAAEETRKTIAEQREQYRPVATRGSVLYFSVVDMQQVNVMYQTSLAQFVTIFHYSMSEAPKNKITSKRVDSIIDTLTYVVYRYINRGLYESHKLLYVFLVAIKILIRARMLEQFEVNLFLRGGAALDPATVRPGPKWLDKDAWMNAIALSQSVPTFASLPDCILRSEPYWRDWINSNEPENTIIPDFDVAIRENTQTGPWSKLQIVRALRVDRTLLMARQFVHDTPIMGPRYVEPVTDTIEDIYEGMNEKTPVIFLLSVGADPTEAIQQLAKKRKNTVSCISMGEGQEQRAINDIRAASHNGTWVLLQNCELGLGLMDEMEDMLKAMQEALNENFRLFITAMPNPKFPLGLLQMSTKVTNEPPNGLRAGLVRSFTVTVDYDRLERIDSPSQAPLWRRLLFTLCFLHSVVQERRKFGPLGWCIPYEYNAGDLNACISFLERHLYAGPISWQTLTYMVAEAYYGGKITDDLDRRMFTAYATKWVTPKTLEDGFSFNPADIIAPIPKDFNYAVMDSLDVDAYRSYGKDFPEIDSPEIFGLHPNADLAFRKKEVKELIETVGETQPRSTGGGGGKARSMDEVVTEKCGELLDQMPDDYIEDDYRRKIRKLGGLSQPMNIFLFQEIQRLQAVIGSVRHMLKQIRLAIKGDVVMTNELQDAMGDIFDARVPQPWLVTPGGDEFSWLYPTLPSWFKSLQERDAQDRGWLEGTVPKSFWMAGFFNPQGFLTAMRQEVTRKHKSEMWALDEVQYFNSVTPFEKPEQVKERPEEGVLIHGLIMDGARWHKTKTDGTLAESMPKVPFSPLPVLHVTAMKKAGLDEKKAMFKPNGPYECPVYRYAARTDRYLVFMAKLVTKNHKPIHWTLRGVALLCVNH